jgi:hypothetical protein
MFWSSHEAQLLYKREDHKSIAYLQYGMHNMPKIQNHTLNIPNIAIRSAHRTVRRLQEVNQSIQLTKHIKTGGVSSKIMVWRLVSAVMSVLDTCRKEQDKNPARSSTNMNWSLWAWSTTKNRAENVVEIALASLHFLITPNKQIKRSTIN